MTSHHKQDYPQSQAITRSAVRTRSLEPRAGSAIVVRPLARVLGVGLTRGGFARVFGRRRRVLDCLAGGVLVAVARMLDQ
jgi:hypothetical protein